MYYEERIIDGVLHYRYSPKDEFTPMSPKGLTKRISKLTAENRTLRDSLEEAVKHLSETTGAAFYSHQTGYYHCDPEALYKAREYLINKENV